MVTLRRITRADDPQLESLLGLYVESFPEEERRDLGQLRRMIPAVAEMQLCAIEHDGELAGLAVYWDMGEFYYMEHLAVFPAMRNHKIGQQVLQWWQANLPKIQLLEVEPPTNPMAERRINLYRRNGLEVLEKSYVQPDYREDRDSCALWVMGTAPHPDLATYIRRIQDVAYREARKYLR